MVTKLLAASCKCVFPGRKKVKCGRTTGKKEKVQTLSPGGEFETTKPSRAQEESWSVGWGVRPRKGEGAQKVIG